MNPSGSAALDMGVPAAPARILIVDDEYGVRSAVQQILELEGYEVAAGGTGEEALALLAARDYDIALLDYRLPDTDGLALHKQIVEDGRQIMTCMITAYADIELACAATFQGIDFFLPKPFMPDDLLGVITTLVARKEARGEQERLRHEHEASLLALAEEKTQTHSLVSSLRDAVLVVNQHGDVVLANRAMTALLGLEESQVLRRPASELLRTGSLAALAESLAAPAKDRTVGQLSIGGQSYMTSIVTFRAEDATALGRILTLSDISQVRRLAMEKERFIRTMVHELKSPLGAVRSIIEVTTDKSMGDDLEAYLPLLRRAEGRIDELVQLISDLLSLSRSEQAQPASGPELLELAPVVDAVLAGQAERLAAKGITASTSIDSELPLVLAPAEDLNVILTNLVGNAVKYNRDGGSVTVRGYRDHEWVRIDVEDTGVGVAAENLERVFTEFFREKRAETRGLEGSGLGLAIVKRLAERAGGHVGLSSESDRGSTFSVFLPA